MFNIRSAALCGLLLAGCASGDESPAPAPPPPGPCATWGAPEAVAQVQDAVINEISGLVASRTQDGVFWIQEDGGAEPVVVAIDEAGVTLATVTLLGVSNNDWEDLATGPCDDETCLYIGNFGDNSGTRTDASILRFVEPSLGDGDPAPVEPDHLPYQYADGPRDAESLIVPADGYPIVLDKRMDGTTVLHRFSTLEPGIEVTLEEVGVMPTGDGNTGVSALATAADLLPSDQRLLVRTYSYLWEIVVPEAGWSGLQEAERVNLGHGPELQGEAAAYSADGQSIWHVGEGSQPWLYRLECEDE